MTGGMLREQQRLVWLVAVAFAVAGVLCWAWMPRQEDPALPNRNGLLVVPVPGAGPLAIEQQVVVPVEEALARVPEVLEVRAIARPDVAIVTIELSETVTAPDPVWDTVEEELALASDDFPAAALPWHLNSDLTALESVVVAVGGLEDPAALRSAALSVEAALRRVAGLEDVVWTADPGDEVRVSWDPTLARAVGLPPGLLAAELAAATAATPGGTVVRGDRRLTLDAGTTLRTSAEVAAHPIQVGDGATAVPLGVLAEVTRGPVAPETAWMRVDGAPAIGLGVVAEDGIDVVALGERVDAALADLATDVPATLSVVAAQPARVDARLGDLGLSLLQGIVVVAGVLLVAMGPRLGLLVAGVVPVVTFSGLAIYALGGGVLQQISIAALVLGLGLLVDNAIVVAERVQARIDDGEERWTAARETVRELALPLFSATATTVASFLPLLLSTGVSADFTRAIPQVVILTLVVSLLVALTLTPTMAATLLRPSAPGRSSLGRVLPRLAALPVRHPWSVLLGAVGMVAAAGALVPFVPAQFFPGADRNQVVLSLELPEGTALAETDAAARVVENALLDLPGVDQVATFVGRSTPAFYYNLPRRPDAPALAQLLVRTDALDDVDAVVDRARAVVQEALPDVVFVARRLGQGPPVAAPVELRVVGDDLDALHAVATALTDRVRRVPGALDVRHDLGPGSPSLGLVFDDARLADLGLTRRDVALTLLAHTRGLPAGRIRPDDRAEPVPVVVRGPAGEDATVEELAGLDVWTQGAGPVPLAAVADLQVSHGPSVVHRRNGQRRAAVLAELAPGVSYTDVLAVVMDDAQALADDAGVSLEVGGEAEGSGEANTSILVAAPIGVGVLLAVLLAQFRSLRRVGVVLLTVPLAAVGVVPGLLLAGQPFGFTSMLGVFALVGIVVNNAILLIDFADRAVESGAALSDALQQAVVARTRPILLTTVTTLVGMAPLLWSESTLWPPLASALMSGLLASTGLTLLVVPAALLLVLGWQPRWPSRTVPLLAAASLVVLSVGASPAQAAGHGLGDAMQAVQTRAAALEAARAQADGASAEARGAWARVLPSVTVDGGITANPRAQTLDLDSAVGALGLPSPSDFEPLFAAFHEADQVAAVFDQVEDPGPPDLDPIVVRERVFRDASVTLRQPLFDPAAVATVRAARAGAAAAEARADLAEEQVVLVVVDAWFGVRSADAEVAVAEAAAALAERQVAEALRQQAVGAGDAVQVARRQAALARAKADVAAARRMQLDARHSLARLTGWPVDVTLDAPGAVDGTEGTVVGTSRLVAAARADAEAARRSAQMVRREGLPRLDAIGQASWTENPGFQDQNTWWVAMARVTWTPVTGGQRLSDAQATSARARAADALARDAEEAAEQARVVAQAAVLEAEARLAAHRAARAAAAEADRVAADALQLGTVAALEREAAALALAAAELDAVRSEAALAHARVDLSIACGAPLPRFR